MYFRTSRKKLPLPCRTSRKNIHCHVLSENSIFLSQKNQTCQMSWESKGTPPMPPPHCFPLTIGFPTAYPWIPMKMESDASCWTHRLTHLEPSLQFASSQFSKALALGKPRSPYVSRRLVRSKFAGTKRILSKVDIIGSDLKLLSPWVLIIVWGSLTWQSLCFFWNMELLCTEKFSLLKHLRGGLENASYQILS